MDKGEQRRVKKVIFKKLEKYMRLRKLEKLLGLETKDLKAVLTHWEGKAPLYAGNEK